MAEDGNPDGEREPRSLLSAVHPSRSRSTPQPRSWPDEPPGPEVPAAASGLDSLDDLMGGPRDRSAGAVVPAQPVRPVGHGEPPTLLPGPGAEYGSSPARHRSARPVGGRVARGVGELLITAGVVVVLFMVYQLWITDIFAARAQDQVRHDLTAAWARQPPAEPGPVGTDSDRVPPVELGDGLAVLRVPRFGPDYAPVVVEGVTTEALRRGPGHFPGSAMPGQIGNFVVSGHRTTYGKPFSRVDELRVGDPIVVEGAGRYFTYRVTGSEIVDPHRLDVTYPVPGRPGEAPTRSLMTLTTCHPRFSAKSRLIIFAELDETRGKSEGAPPVLTGR